MFSYKGFNLNLMSDNRYVHQSWPDDWTKLRVGTHGHRTVHIRGIRGLRTNFNQKIKCFSTNCIFSACFLYHLTLKAGAKFTVYVCNRTDKSGLQSIKSTQHGKCNMCKKFQGKLSKLVFRFFYIFCFSFFTRIKNVQLSN